MKIIIYYIRADTQRLSYSLHLPSTVLYFAFGKMGNRGRVLKSQHCRECCSTVLTPEVCVCLNIRQGRMKRGVGPLHLPPEACHVPEKPEMPRFCVVSLRVKVFPSVKIRLICGRFRADLVNMAGSRRLPSHLGSVLCTKKAAPESCPVL